MHHTKSQIREGFQCFHRFRSYEKHEIYFKRLLQV